MTLTQELDRSDSRVRKFIDACFVIGPAEVRRAMPQADRTRLNTMLLPPPEEISPGGLGTVGTAFDYRVRFGLEGLSARPLAAHRGAALLAGRCEARLSGDRVERIDTNASPVYGLPRSPGVSTSWSVSSSLSSSGSPQAAMHSRAKMPTTRLSPSTA